MLSMAAFTERIMLKIGQWIIGNDFETHWNSYMYDLCAAFSLTDFYYISFTFQS